MHENKQQKNHKRKLATPANDELRFFKRLKKSADESTSVAERSDHTIERSTVKQVSIESNQHGLIHIPFSFPTPKNGNNRFQLDQGTNGSQHLKSVVEQMVNVYSDGNCNEINKSEVLNKVEQFTHALLVKSIQRQAEIEAKYKKNPRVNKVDPRQISVRTLKYIATKGLSDLKQDLVLRNFYNNEQNGYEQMETINIPKHVIDNAKNRLRNIRNANRAAFYSKNSLNNVNSAISYRSSNEEESDSQHSE
jgi:hypothetical protein